MKLLLSLALLASLTNLAHAHPGGNQLECKSAKNSGSKQKIEVSLTRSNGTGWYAPTIKIKVDGHEIEMTTPDEMNNYGETFHNSPLKVISVTANVQSETATDKTGFFSVVGMPNTVKAFDNNNKPVKWSLDLEKEECSDSNGKATFQGIIHGFLQEDGTNTEVDTQILDCTLTYNSGMAC